MTWTAELILKHLKNSKAGQCVTEQDLIAATNFTAHQVDQACLKLRKHGLLEKSGQGCHTITEAGELAIAKDKKLRSGPNDSHYGARKVNANSLRGRVWRAIRIRNKFSLPELIMLVAEDGHSDMTSNIGKYVRALRKAGYLIELKRREKGTAITSNGHKRYVLNPEKDTGRFPPVWRPHKKTVYDPNTEKEVSIAGKEAALCG